MTDFDASIPSHSEAQGIEDMSIASSDGNWYFGRQKQTAFDTGEHRHNVHIVTMITSETSVEQFVDRQLIKHSTGLNRTFVLPLEALHRFEWQQDIEFMYAGCHPSVLREVGQEMIKGDCIELQPQLLTQQDPLIQGILLSLYQEFQLGHNLEAGTNLFIDQLQSTLAMHLLRNYGTTTLKTTDYCNGLSSWKLKQAIDYIQAHLNEEIRLLDLAEQLGMSQYYFARLFKQSMHISPYQYVIQQRINRAKYLLKTTSMSIAAIASQTGFSHQNQLTNQFRKTIGTTPANYRKQQ